MSVREKEVVLEAGWCLNQPRNAGWGALDPCGWRTEWGGGRSTRPSASKPSQLNLKGSIPSWRSQRGLLGLAICPSLPRLLKRLGGPFWGCMLGGPVTASLYRSSARVWNCDESDDGGFQYSRKTNSVLIEREPADASVAAVVDHRISFSIDG
ncbi:hypothetical protein V1477_005639 [Vespula maculifrons]|uniref:Uncharacterized protein n=1 Tax=Vespula maculifrons TaxID=7453 RepID=A0ABD2CRD2_VESMC